MKQIKVMNIMSKCFAQIIEGKKEKNSNCLQARKPESVDRIIQFGNAFYNKNEKLKYEEKEMCTDKIKA